MSKEELLNEIITAIRQVPTGEALEVLEWLHEEIGAYIDALEDELL